MLAPLDRLRGSLVLLQQEQETLILAEQKVERLTRQLVEAREDLQEARQQKLARDEEVNNLLRECAPLIPELAPQPPSQV